MNKVVGSKITSLAKLFEQNASGKRGVDIFLRTQINRIFYEFKFIFPTLLDPFSPLKIL